ncbi:MAG: TIGR03905 family TSCPD domain-containing protein [Lachnospiraceae bacterium]|nr:TIGR03905 family TSCPD domain-containing protein [Lachnospiraceae bacterium]
MNYKTTGVCAREINFEVEEKGGKKIIKSVQFVGGCNGNTSGISKLVQGMEVEEVIKRLEGVTCGPKKTSCPDQLAHALRGLV